MSLRLITAALSATVALASGCGGDDNDSLSYDETGEELSAICQKYDTASDEGRLTGKVDQDAPVIADINEQTEKGLEEIRELEVNEELEDARDEFVTVVEGSLERGQELQELAEAGDQRGYIRKIRELQRVNSELGAEAEAAASRLGAPACGQNT